MTTPPSSAAFRHPFRPLVVLWGFPELSQTFIHREIAEWRRVHPDLRILAGARRHPVGADPETLEWARTLTLYLPSPWIWGPRGLLRGLSRPGRFLPTLAWIATRPHRSLLHRLRALAMCVAAADSLPRVLRRRPDYLHAHFASYVTEWTMCLSRMSGIPWGGSWHAVDIWKDRNILAEKIRDAAIVLTCTRHNRDYLAALAAGTEARVRLAYHGIRFDRLGEPAPAPTGSPVILAIGRLVEKKGFHHLLAACARLREEGAGFALRVVGEGPEATALRGLADRLGISDRVTWLGAQSNAATLDEIRGCALLAAPSIPGADGNIDGIPNVILEAMALGRPVVGSDFSGIPEVVKDGETGLLVPPGDEAALASALRALLGDPERARALGAAAAAFVRERFDAARNARLQLEMIHAALEAGPGQRGGSKS